MPARSPFGAMIWRIVGRSSYSLGKISIGCQRVSNRNTCRRRLGSTSQCRARGSGVLSRWTAKLAGAARSSARTGGTACGIFAAISTVTLLLGGCGENGVIARFMLKSDHIIIERRPDPVYDRLFPYYVELCATSQFRSKLKGEGGVAGHAVMYIKGACKDEQAPYPQLRRCRVAATELDDPEHGAGVSVGRWFRNVNWVAIPGYELFYQGNLKIGERLTQAHFEATVRDAIDKGVYKGVEFHDYPTAGALERASKISSRTRGSAPISRFSSPARSFARAFR